MANPKALYQEVILDHNRKPRNYGTLGVFAVISDAKCLGV